VAILLKIKTNSIELFVDFYSHDAMLVWSLLSKDVCPSHAGIVSKWLNLSQNFCDHLVAPSS